MARPEKEATVQEITETFKNATSIFVTDYQGLNVEKISQFRRNCREKSVEYKVIKNTLARIAAKNAGFEQMADYLQGPSAIAYTFEDPSSPAKVISDFAKENDKPQIKMSLFEGVFYGPEKVEQIASLPTKDELLSKMVGSLKSPIQGFAGCLSGLLGNFVRTLDAVREQKEKNS